MYQLTVEVIDSLLELAVVRGELSLNLFDFEKFQPLFLVIFALIWVAIRQTLAFVNPKWNTNRLIGITHAVLMVTMGFPVIRLLTSKSFDYMDMLESIKVHHAPLNITCNFMCYVSVGYFLMDSYFLVRKAYLKHHIGAITVWVMAAYHHETSLVHGVVIITLFETGAILVQLSRMYPNNLPFRTLICAGYTCTRLSIAWYYGFTWTTTMTFFWDASPFKQALYFLIWPGLIFLLVLNAKWTFMQWKALIKSYAVRFGKKEKDDQEDFFTYHQRIIGNTTPAAPVKA